MVIAFRSGPLIFKRAFVPQPLPLSVSRLSKLLHKPASKVSISLQPYGPPHAVGPEGQIEAFDTELRFAGANYHYYAPEMARKGLNRGIWCGSAPSACAYNCHVMGDCWSIGDGRSLGASSLDVGWSLGAGRWLVACANVFEQVVDKLCVCIFWPPPAVKHMRPRGAPQRLRAQVTNATQSKI